MGLIYAMKIYQKSMGNYIVHPEKNVEFTRTFGIRGDTVRIL